jgi:hypothetical protein
MGMSSLVPTLVGGGEEKRKRNPFDGSTKGKAVLSQVNR